MRYEWEAGEGGGAKELEVGKRGVGKKCLNVRQKLGTRKKFKTLKFWKLLKRENFHNFENIIKWSLGHAEQLLFSCLYAFQKTLIIGENDNDFFYLSLTLTCAFRVHRAGSQLINIDN